MKAQRFSGRDYMEIANRMTIARFRCTWLLVTSSDGCVTSFPPLLSLHQNGTRVIWVPRLQLHRTTHLQGPLNVPRQPCDPDLGRVLGLCSCFLPRKAGEHKFCVTGKGTDFPSL